MGDSETVLTPRSRGDEESPRSGGGNASDGLDTTFQFDEDTIHSLSNSVDAPVVRSKKRKSRRKRLSESLSQPRFSDSYKYTGDPFLGCGSYGSVYTCSSLKAGSDSKSHKDKSLSSSLIGPLDSPPVKGSGGGTEGGNPEREDSPPKLLSAEVTGGGEVEEEDEEEFAVKIIDKKGHSRSRLFNEIEILHQCKDHPNIVQLVDFIEEDHSFFLIFEKINGGPLLDHISMHGRFAERETSLVTRDIATALTFLHSKGIAHRDLKPANILCVHRHSVAPVKLCDFDLASAPWTRDDSLATEYSEDCIDLMSPVGSAEYMAPEVVSVFIGGQAAAAYDKRCDLWSLGVILYILLCGYPPFVGRCGYDCGWVDGRSCIECQSLLMQAIREDQLVFPAEDWHSVSPEAKDLVTRLLERDISKRLTAAEVLQHDWLKTASLVASNPIPLLNNNNATRMRKVSGAAKAIQGEGWKFTYNETMQRCTKSKDGSSSPEERERLGTEDSGFGGDNVSGVVGLLIDAVNDDEGLHQNCSDSGIRLDSLKNIFDGNEKESKTKDQQQFELSDDESLFSSGYGFSIDLPPSACDSRSSFADRCQIVPTEGEEFGFENVSKQQLELEIASEFELARKHRAKEDFEMSAHCKNSSKEQTQGINPLADCTSTKLNDCNEETLNRSKLSSDDAKDKTTQKSLEAIRSFKSSKP